MKSHVFKLGLCAFVGMQAACLCAQTSDVSGSESSAGDAVNALTLTGVQSADMSDYVLTVALQNSATVRDLSCELTLPAAFTASATDVTVATRAASHQAALTALSEGSYRLVFYSPAGTAVEGSEGAIFDLRLHNAASADVTGQAITLSDIRMSASDGTQVTAVQTANEASLTIAAEVSGTAYAGSSDAQSMSLSQFKALREVSPNAIFVIEGAGADIADGISNVVCRYEVDGVSAYVCRQLVLTDLENFYSPVDFVARSVSYHRTVGASTHNSTACFPFALSTADLPTGYQILTFAYFKPIEGQTDGGYVYFNSNEAIRPGVPCFLYNEAPSDWDITLSNAPIVATPDFSGGLKGVFARTPISTFSNCYRPSGNNTKLTAATSDIMPFRSVLSLSYDAAFNGGGNHDDASQQAPSRLEMIILPGDAQGIETLRSDSSDTLPAYNVNGQRVNANQTSGVIIVDNKKVIK